MKHTALFISALLLATNLTLPSLNNLDTAIVENSNAPTLNTASSSAETANWGNPGDCEYRVATIPYFDPTGVIRYKQALTKVCNKCIRAGQGGQACPWDVPKGIESK